MKFLCKYHQIHPDQTGSMNCDDCNRCSKCEIPYYNNQEEEANDDKCPNCGEI